MLNLKFVRMLQKMADVEQKDHHFRSKKYVIVKDKDQQVAPGEVGVVLKHPDNVIVVASPTGKSPPPQVGETRVAHLSKAIEMAAYLSRFSLQGCSIVVHEGLYINPFIDFGERGMINLNFSVNFSLEIVGTNEVRILMTDESVNDSFLTIGMQLSMRNLLIYDWNERKKKTMVVSQTKLTLADVRIHGSTNSPVSCFDKSEANISDCSFTKCTGKFLFQESKGNVSRCRWTDIDGDGFINHGSVVQIEYCVFKEIRSIDVSGDGTFRRCEFVARPRPHSDSAFVGICANSGGKLAVKNCTISRYRSPFGVQDFHAHVTVKRSIVKDCFMAISAQLNGNFLFEKCELGVFYIGLFRFYVRGKAQFRNNYLKPSHFEGLTPRADSKRAYASFTRDCVPDVLEHDFKQLTLEHPDVKGPFPMEKPPKDRRICCNCSKSEQLEKLRCSLAKEPEIKFRFCSACRKVLYCSEECKNANWKDHKLICDKI